MFKTIKEFFSTRIEPTADDESDRAYRLQLATAALLVEVMQADNRVTPEEVATVRSSIRRAFDLSLAETEELVRLARREVDEAHPFYEFSHLIDQSFDRARRRVASLSFSRRLFVVVAGVPLHRSSPRPRIGVRPSA